MKQPGSTARDDEPVSGGDAEDAGSVVVGLDPSADNGVYAHAAADIGALFGLGRTYDPRYAEPTARGKGRPGMPVTPDKQLTVSPFPAGEIRLSAPLRPEEIRHGVYVRGLSAGGARELAAELLRAADAVEQEVPPCLA